jgi:HSP20 family protein
MRKVFTSVLELMRLQSEMNRIFEMLEALQGDDYAFDIEYAPLYDVFETADSVVIEMDLPGCDPQSLKLTASGSHIFVEGVRVHAKRKSAHYHLLERSRGKFKRTVVVDGAFNTHKGKATFQKGVLRVEFPKVKDRRGAPHPIEMTKEEESEK